jgi:hypothetical protein
MSRGAGRNNQNAGRDARIAQLRAMGIGVRALAERFSLSPTYVTTIVAKAKKGP